MASVFMQRIFQFAQQKKKTTGFFVLVAVVGLYFGFKVFNSNAATPHYVLAAVSKGTLITSISGSGQVAASNQVDVKPKVSGDIIYVPVKLGQQVWAGQLLAEINPSDAQKAVRDAQINLQSAQISLQRLQNNQQAGGKTSSDNLAQAYKDAYNKITDSFLNMPNLLDSVRAVLYDNALHTGCDPNMCGYGNLVSQDVQRQFQSMVSQADADYKSAKSAYDPNFQDYQSLRIDSTNDQIVAILNRTKNTAELLSQAAKSEQNLLNLVVTDINNQAAKQGLIKGVTPALITTYQGNLGSDIGSLNSIVSNLTNAQHSIDSSTQTISDNSLGDPLDLTSQENTVSQRQAAVQDAQDNLAKYYIRAPFTGIIAKLGAVVGDSAGSGTAVATLLTQQQIAQLSLNEVDASKIKVGQKATLTFDAVDGLSITGQVLEIDPFGTVTQGVVTYAMKIGFDTQDSRVKPGMSVSASIITDTKLDALLVPNSAIKNSGGTSYVQIPQDSAAAAQLMANGTTSTGIAIPVPKQQAVQIGLSNDTYTEVTGGLNEGDLVITRTITATAAKTATTTQNSLFPTTGRTGGGGNATFRGGTATGR